MREHEPTDQLVCVWLFEHWESEHVFLTRYCFLVRWITTAYAWTRKKIVRSHSKMVFFCWRLKIPHTKKLGKKYTILDLRDFFLRFDLMSKCQEEAKNKYKLMIDCEWWALLLTFEFLGNVSGSFEMELSNPPNRGEKKNDWNNFRQHASKLTIAPTGTWIFARLISKNNRE